MKFIFLIFFLFLLIYINIKHILKIFKKKKKYQLLKGLKFIACKRHFNFQNYNLVLIKSNNMQKHVSVSRLQNLNAFLYSLMR